MRRDTESPAGQNAKCSESRNFCSLRDVTTLSTTDVLARFSNHPACLRDCPVCRCAEPHCPQDRAAPLTGQEPLREIFQ